MEAKTIKISEENYRWLLNVAAELQKQQGRIITFDNALNELRRRKMKRRNLSDLAGKWKMNEKEADKLLEEIYNERKIVSRRL